MFISVLEVTDPGYDVFCFGPFIKEIPKRIGHSAALDATTTAFATAVRGVKAKERSVETLQRYTAALQEVQNALSNPETAYTAETLCSIYLIMVSHSWVARKDDKYPNHGAGLAHLLKIMTDREPHDPFIKEVMVTVSVAVIIEGIFNPSIKLHPWINKLAEMGKPSAADKETAAEHGLSFDSIDMKNLGMIPELIHNPWQHLDTIDSIYKSILAEYPGVKSFGENVLGPVCVGPPGLLPLKLVRASTRFDAAQCLMLTIGIVMNGFLRCIRPEDKSLIDECFGFCADSINLAERAKSRRPLAAGHIPLSLVAAWLSSDDIDQQEQLNQLIREYDGDFAMMSLLKMASYLKEALPEAVLLKLQALPPWSHTGDKHPQSGQGIHDFSSDAERGAETCSIL